MFEKVKKLCTSHNITIAELERHCSLSNGTINKWQYGRTPTIVSLKAVADYFGCTVDELLMEDA